MESKKIRETIGEEKMEKTKARKEINVELFIVSKKNNTDKHNSWVMPLLIKSYSLGGISSLVLVLF